MAVMKTKRVSQTAALKESADLAAAAPAGAHVGAVKRMSKTVSENQFNRLAGQIEQLDLDQLGHMFAEVLRRKIAAAEVSAPIGADAMLSTKEAADFVRVTDETVRRWCHQYGIGRQISGVWVVSGVLLEDLIRSGRVVLPTQNMPDGPHDIQKIRA